MSEQKRILVVDDEPSIVKLATISLTREGYEVSEAYNGEEAIKKANEEKPDLILLDIMMPKMDGWEVTKHLKDNDDTKNIPIIMLTSKGVREQGVEGMGVVDEYFTKPFSPSGLAKLVQNVLERRE